MTKEELKNLFSKQLEDPKSLITEEIYKSLKEKSKKCFHDCPDVEIGDRVLFAVVCDVQYLGNNIKKKLRKSDIIGAYKKLEDNKTNMQLCKITERYLESDDCVLLHTKAKITENVENLIPRLYVLESVM